MIECGVGGIYGDGKVEIDEKKRNFPAENATVHEFLK